MKKVTDPLTFSAREAAGELGISLPTLYAYVSRGLIRSEPDPGSRARRYRGEDVRALRARRQPAGERAGIDRGALSWGAPVIESAITCVTAEGPSYRGRNACHLAETATLEQAATLLWGCDDSDPFASHATAAAALPEGLHQVLVGLRPIDRMAAAMAVSGDLDPQAHSRTAGGQAAAAARILRLATRVALDDDPGGDAAHLALARQWAGAQPAAADLLRRALVLLADHELNASTFTARCAASTGASLYDCVAAGLAALKGPKHGGAALRAARLLRALVEGDPRADARSRATLGEPFPGFGHRLYPQGDPRARALLQALERAGASDRLLREIPSAVAEATGEEPSIDYALAALAWHLALPDGVELTLFALSRTVGWLAHAMEQRAGSSLIRPRARYTGLAPRLRDLEGHPAGHSSEILA